MKDLIELLLATRMYIYSITFDKMVEYGYDVDFANREALKQVKEIDDKLKQSY